MDGKKKQPAFIVAVLALLGASFLPQVFKGQDGTIAPVTQDETGKSVRTAVSSDELDSDLDRRDLKPFLDFISDGSLNLPSSGNLKNYIDERLEAISGPDEPELYCLVLAMPEPIESPASARFDEFLDVMQRAVEL